MSRATALRPASRASAPVPNGWLLLEKEIAVSRASETTISASGRCNTFPTARIFSCARSSFLTLNRSCGIRVLLFFPLGARALDNFFCEAGEYRIERRQIFVVTPELVALDLADVLKERRHRRIEYAVSIPTVRRRDFVNDRRGEA